VHITQHLGSVSIRSSKRDLLAHDRKGKKESYRTRSCCWLNYRWALWSYRILWNANWQMAFRFISNWYDNRSASDIDSHGYLILEIETTDRSISKRAPCINAMVEGAGTYFGQNRIAQILNNRANNCIQRTLTRH
jgi:hypothetical protein